MEELNPLMLSTMIELLRVGAGRGYVPLSTNELARRLGQSQQAASLHLVKLEADGMIERRKAGPKTSLRVTPRGMDTMRAFHSELKSVLEDAQEYTIRGKLFKGLGEGAYYIGMDGYKQQLTAVLGFEPYPGTLNLRLDSPMDMEQNRQLHFKDGLRIHGFSSGGRTYGGATCYKAMLNGTQAAALLVIDRTHYDDTVLEIVAPVYVRDALGLKDGDEVRVNVFL